MSPRVVRCTFAGFLMTASLLFARAAAPAAPAAPADGAAVPAAAATRPASQPATRPAGELEAERIASAEDSYRIALTQYQQGLAPYHEAATWLQRWAKGALDSGLPRERKVEILKKCVEQARDAEVNADRYFQNGLGKRLDFNEAHYARIEAELCLARAEPARAGAAGSDADSGQRVAGA